MADNISAEEMQSQPNRADPYTQGLLDALGVPSKATEVGESGDKKVGDWTDA